MMSSMSMGDFISPTGSSLSPLDSSGLRVSHEHTDSGLGADQDYAYSSERSSDSAKYGTNKSSGASVTSGHTKSSSSNTMKSHHHTSPSFNKSIDYLENYKTGVERLNQGNSSLNNNNPESFTGLLGMGVTGSQNVLNNNNNNNNGTTAQSVGSNGPWEVINGTKGEGGGDQVGPLICFDSNRNQDGTRTDLERTVTTPTRDTS
uniref:Uncharacterized protein n=1 Tax=Anopheles maculatus TaxID=74869 RepID=A0A182S757_9DIPT